MSNFIEILGENKAALNKDLSVRITLEQPAHLHTETNLFQNVDQEAQFYKEKQQSTTLRVYGTVAPSLNLRLKGGEKPNYDFFRFTDKNWQIALFKPTRFLDGPGKQHFLKDNIHEYNFKYGLPMIKVIPEQDELKSYIAFNCYLGHNFQVDDRVYITSLDPEYLHTDYYNVIGVDGNVVYIDMEYREVVPDWNENEFTTEVTIDEQVAKLEAEEDAIEALPKLSPPNITQDNEFVEVNVQVQKKGWWLWRRKKTVVTEVRSKYMGAVSIKNAAPDSKMAADNNEIFRVGNNELGVLNEHVIKELKKKRPNLSKVLQPKFFIKKVQEDYQLSYYMKQVEVVALVNEFDDCAFSLSATGEQVMNFTFPDVNVDHMVDNHGVPVTELFLGIIKVAGNKDVDLSDVESNFSKVIDFTDLGHGLETVMTKQEDKELDLLKVGDKMFLALCEYDHELLQETEIAYLNHRVIHKDVSFAYKPFTPIQIKSFSSYVEDSETSANIPDHAIYSGLRQKYIWRDILDIGFFEGDGTGLDYPFLNGAFYIYEPVVFTLRNDFSVKYRYNTNDINKLKDLDLEIDSIKDILDSLLEAEGSEGLNNKGYEEFKIKKC
jgi:hypothetical protein